MPLARYHLLLLGAAFLLPGCTEPQHPPGGPAAGLAVIPARAPRSPADSTAYVFDVPALVGLTADQIIARLGKPVRDRQESIDEQVKSLLYQRQNYNLSVEYDVQSRRVVRFYMNPHKLTKDNQPLLDAANIDPSDSRFTVEYLNEEDGRYQGMLIVPDSASLPIRR